MRMVADGKWPGVYQWQLTEGKEEAMRLAVHRAATDASTSWGAGAVWGFERFKERWSEADREMHISWLELMAILLAVRRWAIDWAGSSVLVESDNSAAVAYINKGGGKVPEGRQMMKEVTMLCLEHNIELRAEHIAGVLNVAPDGLSRDTEAESTADYMFADYESYNDPPHSADAACSGGAENMQRGCSVYFAPGKRSFLTNWREAAGHRIWCNPPYVEHVIRMFMLAVEAAWRLDERTVCTLVVPAWTQQSWYRRAVTGRRRPLWSTLATLPKGVEGRFLQGEAQRLRHFGHRAPKLAAPPEWDVLVMRFPAYAL